MWNIHSNILSVHKSDTQSLISNIKAKRDSLWMPSTGQNSCFTTNLIQPLLKFASAVIYPNLQKKNETNIYFCPLPTRLYFPLHLKENMHTQDNWIKGSYINAYKGRDRISHTFTRRRSNVWRKTQNHILSIRPMLIFLKSSSE